MTNERLIKESFAKQAENFENSSMNFSNEEYLAYTVRKMGLCHKDIVLEVASGTCVNGRAIAPYVDKVICLDLTPEMLEVGRQKAEEQKLGNMIFVLGNAYEIPFLNNYFDVVFSRFAFHHFTDTKKAFDEMKIKPKDLVGIPWMVAFALRADGWYLRQDIIWHKPNPMPESVKDRCTKAHEYIFLLAKSAQYYYDNEAIKEPVKEISIRRAEYGWDCDRPSTKNASMNGKGIHTKKMGTRFVNPDGRNKRSVWTVTTKPFKEAHFAVFPEDLIEPCILAGTSPQACEICGAPWERVVERKRFKRNELPPSDPRYRPNVYQGAYDGINGKGDAGYTETKTIGWQPTCTCQNEGKGRCIVLDPFMGSGTTAVVALKHNRNYIGIELNPEYIKIAEKRVQNLKHKKQIY